jgi:hypothetical protein
LYIVVMHTECRAAGSRIARAAGAFSRSSIAASQFLQRQGGWMVAAFAIGCLVVLGLKAEVGLCWLCPSLPPHDETDGRRRQLRRAPAADTTCAISTGWGDQAPESRVERACAPQGERVTKQRI